MHSYFRIILAGLAVFSCTKAGAEVIVRPSVTQEAIKPMHCVNNGPAGARSPHLSTFDEYEDAGIPMARLHDSPFQWHHAVDINQIFPNFGANENKAESYDFSCTDAYLKNILGIGTEIFFRLGQSIEHEVKKYGTIPPKDYKKWARICEHIIMHYNEGWADGFHYGIKYWEIWNEPDNNYKTENWKTYQNTCWNGSVEDFFEFYRIVSDHLNKKFPELKIGGPSLCENMDWAELFLDYCNRNGVELDFFSWHIYTHSPEEVAKRCDEVKTLLDKYGYGNAESILNEWNYNLGWIKNYAYSKDVIHNSKGGAFMLATMQECQRKDVDMLMYYDARMTVDWNGLFDAVNKNPLPGYYALYVWNKLYRMGTGIESVSTDDKIRATAAKNENGRIGVAVSYFTNDDGEKECEPVKIDIKIEDQDKDTEYLGWVVDHQKTFAGISPHVENGIISIYLWPNSFVYYETR